MKEAEKEMMCWMMSPNEGTNIYAVQTEDGVNVSIESKAGFSKIDEDGTTHFQLKKETAAALSNILAKTLIGNPTNKKELEK